jgi:hypothetical protein
MADMTGSVAVSGRCAHGRSSRRIASLAGCKDRAVPEDYSSDAPWLPPADPWEFKLDARGRLDLEWLARTLDSKRAELLIRSHLRAPNPKDKAYKSNWEMFWRAVGYSDPGPVAELMERWLDAADAELAAGDPDSESLRPVRRFRSDVDQAYHRLERHAIQPLAWAGATWARYPVGPRRVIEALVAAIALHRDQRIGDTELYSVLQALGLDPGPHAERITPENLSIVFDALATGTELDYS